MHTYGTGAAGSLRLPWQGSCVGIDHGGDVDVDVVVVGGGQAALAAGYYLQRANRDRPSGRAPLRFVLLDQQPAAGGAWREGWESLRLFSPAAYSSLPGWPMPAERGSSSETPSADHVRQYLADYEQRYQLPVRRPVRVTAVERDPEGDGFRVATDQGTWSPRMIISATGTWGRPFWPRYPGMTTFRGRQLHTQHYRRAADFEKARVLVVGWWELGGADHRRPGRPPQTAPSRG